MNRRSLSRITPCQAGIALVFVSLALAGISGCGGAQPDLTLTCPQTHKVYQQPFDNAYASWRNGDLEVILADDAAVAALGGSATHSPVRQILHVHVLWDPNHGLGAGAPSVTNATLHWYVLGDPSRAGDMLEYTGTAYVVSNGDPESPTITIQYANLKCAYQHGLADPVGNSRLQGSVTAITDDRRVGQLLREVEQSVGPPTAASTVPASPSADVRQ